MDIKDILQSYKIEDTKNRKTERGELLKEFLQSVNAERGVKFKPLTFGRMAKLLKGKSLQELYGFLSQCKDRKVRNGSFSKYFWYSLKIKE